MDPEQAETSGGRKSRSMHVLAGVHGRDTALLPPDPAPGWEAAEVEGGHCR